MQCFMCVQCMAIVNCRVSADFTRTGNSHHRVSACLCVTRRYCIKTAKRRIRIMQTTPRDSPGTLCFLTPKFVGGRPPFPLKFALKVTHPFLTAQFRPIFAHSAFTVRAGEKSSISTNRKSTTRFPTSHRWTVSLPLRPQRVTQNAILLFFPVNFNYCRIKSVAKFHCVKTSSGKVVATSFLYLTFHRRIVGDVPIYL